MTVTATATVEADNIPPRVRLDISATTETSTIVTRLNPDGTTVVVRTNDGNPTVLSAHIGLLYDYEAPFGMPVTYSTIESPATVSAAVTVPESRIWLIHPGLPVLSMPIEMMLPSLMEENYAVKQGVFYPMGRATPIVVTDGARGSAQSSLAVLTEDLAGQRALRTLISDAGVLLLNIPAGMGMGLDTCYIAVQDVRMARLTDVAADPMRVATLPFVTVAMPAGGSQAERTLADFLDFPTLAALAAAYPTLFDLAAGP